MRLDWTYVETIEDLEGPILLIVDRDIPQILSVSEENIIQTSSCSSPSTFEPDDVSCVFRGMRVFPGIFAIKSYQDQYLGSDLVGNVSINRKAIGPGENWSVEFVQDGKMTFKNNAFGRYLSFDLLSNKLRADSDSIGTNEIFIARCQVKHQYQRKKLETEKLESKDAIDPLLLEKEEVKKYHAYCRHSDDSSENASKLKKAMEDGRLREALLEQRINQKHDKFC